MLRTVDDWEGQAFAFGTDHGPQSPAQIAIPSPSAGSGTLVTVPDAHLLFTADFSRTGSDLVLHGEEGKSFVVRDYFAGDERARLFSPEGASLSPEMIAALAGPLAPGQYAQAAPAPAAAQAVGRVAKVEGGVTIMRNGVAITPQVGDAVQKGDVLVSASGSLGVTFNDGSTLNLTANSRLVVDEFVYDPNGSANSQILNLVQGSLTFISGEVAHSGDMKIGTPVATMGIRGTVGGVTTASDGTVSFYIVQSERGAVLTDHNGVVLAEVVQNGPLIVVRPLGPLQVLAQEVQKTPDQLAAELAALQHIVSVKAVGDVIVRQFFQPDPTQPNQPPSGTQIQIDLLPKSDSGSTNGPSGGGDGVNLPGAGNVIIPDNDDNGPRLPGTNQPPIVVPIPPDLPPVNFAPADGETNEDTPLVFNNQNGNRISVFDADTAVLRVTLAATHGTLTLSGTAGLIFIIGDGDADGVMTFTGPRAAINAALDGLAFNPDADYSGAAAVSIVTSDGSSTTGPLTVDIEVNPVNDPAILSSAAVDRTEGDSRRTLKAEGCLTISDIDSAEAFQPQNHTQGQYGSFSIDEDGHWSYRAYSAHNAFAEDRVYTDTFEVLSADGTVTTVTINITGTNDAPMIDSDCAVAAFVEDGCAIPVAPDLRVSDVDSPMLGGAKVSITGNFRPGEDVLGFVNQNGITGTFAAATGILLLTGVATLAHYEAALRSVTYFNGSDTPSESTRTVSFQVDDGADKDNLSNVGTATVAVAPMNDAPAFDDDSFEFTADEDAPAGSLVGIAGASDADGDGLTYTIVSGNDDNAFAIDGEGRITVTGLLNYEEAGRDLVVRASDPDGAAGEAAIHVDIVDVAEPDSTVLTSTGGVSISVTGEGATRGFVLQGGDNVTTPGTPEDRILLGYDLGDDRIVRNAAPMMNDFGLAPISTALYSEDGVNYFASLLSAGNDVPLTQTVGLGADANFFITKVDIFNGGDADITNVRFMRNIDPDQDVDTFGTFDTFNDVLQNPGPSSPVAAVSATGAVSGAEVVLVGADTNWRASAFGFTNINPYADAAFDNPQDPNGARDDIAIVLTNHVGTIPAGGSAHIEFITTANVATAGANALVGTTDDNRLDGLAGDDLLFGLAGADTFMFKPGYGNDTVVDFSGHGGQHDRIDLAEFGFMNFNDLRNNVAFDDIVLDDGTHAAFFDFGDGDTLTLRGVDPDTLTATDFIFQHGLA